MHRTDSVYTLIHQMYVYFSFSPFDQWIYCAIKLVFEWRVQSGKEQEQDCKMMMMMMMATGDADER